MGIIRLTPAQTLRIHGLFPTSTLLNWETIEKKKLSFARLHHDVYLTVEQLYTIQPDINKWVCGCLVSASDTKDMNMWPLNPIVHCEQSIFDLVGNSVLEIKSCGVTYKQLCDAGMTPYSMQLFHFSLREWVTLGFQVSDLDRDFNSAQTFLLFGGDVKTITDEMSSLKCSN